MNKIDEKACNTDIKEESIYIKIVHLLNEIPLGKLSFLFVIYVFTFFLLPYFVHYRFLPIDTNLSSLPIKLILLSLSGVFSTFVILFLSLIGNYMFIFSNMNMYASDKEISSEKDESKQDVEKFWVYIIGNYLIYVLAFGLSMGIYIYILIITKYNSTIFMFIFMLICPYIFFLIIRLIIKYIMKYIKSIIRLIINYISKNCKELDLKSLIGKYFTQYLSFFVSIFGLFFIFMISIATYNDIQKGKIIYISFAIFIINFLSLFALLPLKDSRVKIFLTFLGALAIPSLYIILLPITYISILKAAYSFLGVSSAPADSATLCISKNSNIAIPESLYSKNITSNIPLKTIKPKLLENFMCFKGVNVVWNGDNYVWISNKEKVSDNEFVVKIPKSILLNEDVIFLKEDKIKDNQKDKS